MDGRSRKRCNQNMETAVGEAVGGGGGGARGVEGGGGVGGGAMLWLRKKGGGGDGECLQSVSGRKSHREMKGGRKEGEKIASHVEGR